MNQSLSCSIIIPVHNGAKTLGRCLDALAAQVSASGAGEVIVVDDASTDGTAAVAQAHGVRVVTLLEQAGPAAARNAGAGMALGDVLLFTDADCEPVADWCQQMLRPLADPQVCGTYGAYRTRQTAWVARLAQAEFDERYARLAGQQNIDFFATHAAAVRRDAFLEVGGFRTDLRGNEDVELAFRISRKGYRLVFAPQAVVYHEHPATLRSYLWTKVSRGYWRTLTYAAHPGKALADAYTPPWLKLQVAGMVAALLMLPLSALHVTFCSLLLLTVSVLVLTTLPFTVFVSRADPDLVFVSSLFSLLRSAALALGVIAGLVAVGMGKYQHEDTKTPRH